MPVSLATEAVQLFILHTAISQARLLHSGLLPDIYE